jgi:hypothetical protein
MKILAVSTIARYVLCIVDGKLHIVWSNIWPNNWSLTETLPETSQKIYFSQQ